MMGQADSFKMAECDEHWKTAGRVHMLGLCGVGMAGLAYMLTARGWRVSGCDAQINLLADWLLEIGVSVTHGHAPMHLEGIDRVIVTSAVAATNSELCAAVNLKMPVSRRGEVLAALVSAERGVAVCGTHGKTTTACFTTRLLQVLGISPQWCIGGMTRRLGGVAGGEPDATLLVVEADESDGTLAQYHSEVMVLANIDLDHLEYFDGEQSLQACFRQAVVQTRKGVAVCCDDARAWQVAQAAIVPVLGFGFSEAAVLRAKNLRIEADSMSFEIVYQGTSWGRVTLGVSGRHNVLNALGAAAAALIIGVAPREVFNVLTEACDELPLRRFETVAEVSGIRFVVDYAHHPAELKAAVEMACLQHQTRLFVIFQPHRYTRTRALGALFPAAFDGADEVILLPVYAASESQIEGGDACDLYNHFRKNERAGQKLMLARSLTEVWGYLEQVLRAGDLVLIAGAGDIIGLTDRVLAAQAQGWPNQVRALAFETALRDMCGVSVMPFGSIKDWSFLGVGGWARWRVEVEDEVALTAVLTCCYNSAVTWRMVGMGANTWFSDLGEIGCVIRFAREACSAVKIKGCEVEVGCGLSGATLLDMLERAGLSGLEFLDSIPGRVGGWLAMNAGAHGGEIGAHVTWIRYLNSEGKVSILEPFECGFKYRHCEGLEGRVALSCGLRLVLMDPEKIKARRQEVRTVRIPLMGLRTAGSVFMNPAGESAGVLLESAGCKSLRIGGARVLDVHANIVAVEEGATASDVLALILKMQNQVEQRFSVVLQPEISGLMV